MVVVFVCIVIMGATLSIMVSRSSLDMKRSA